MGRGISPPARSPGTATKGSPAWGEHHGTRGLAVAAPEVRASEAAGPELAGEGGAHEACGLVWREAKEDFLEEIVRQRRRGFQVARPAGADLIDVDCSLDGDQDDGGPAVPRIPSVIIPLPSFRLIFFRQIRLIAERFKLSWTSDQSQSLSRA